MGHQNRGRVAVQPGASSLLYPVAKIPGWEHVGLVTVGDETSQLVRNKRTGIYAMARSGGIRSLDQRKVLAALQASVDGA